LTCIDMELSIGDYILSGGELGAMVIVDAVSRLIPGVLGGERSNLEDSFEDGLLEYPQYTRPRVFPRTKRGLRKFSCQEIMKDSCVEKRGIPEENIRKKA